jgi:hypothetical protein
MRAFELAGETPSAVCEGIGSSKKPKETPAGIFGNVEIPEGF